MQWVSRCEYTELSGLALLIYVCSYVLAHTGMSRSLVRTTLTRSALTIVSCAFVYIWLQY
jgi:hypothetical protein